MSGIIITVNAGETSETSSVTVKGEVVDIIADSERASFSIGSDSDLKRAVEKSFGKKPNDAFLHSPTPWDDLYKTYGWSQVERVLEPKKAVILGVDTKPTIVATKTLRNEGSEPANFTTNMTETVSNTESNQWTNSNTVTIGASATFKLDMIVAGAEGTANIGFTHTWGQNGTVTNQTTLSTETGVSVVLKPGESEIVIMSASMGKMRVQITYEAYLRGQTAINYNPTFKDHHFHALDIGEVLGDSNRVQITQDIEVGYYSNATCDVKDAEIDPKH